jgi:squalene synthase HpnC
VPPAAAHPAQDLAGNAPAGALPLDAAAPSDAALASASRRENFHVLSRLVPPDLRPDFQAVYAFCRTADDLADDTGLPAGAADAALASARLVALERLARFRVGLTACFEGRPVGPLFEALARTAERRALVAAPFHRLLDAFEQDQRVATYETWDQLLHYCRGSADPVGHIVLTLAGHRPPDEAPEHTELYRRSDAVCTALQLANHWQDVRRDLFERGRVYAPSEITGFSIDQLRDWAARPNDPEARVPFIRGMRPLLDRTRALFDEGAPLPAMVDPRIARLVWLFAAGGRRILRKTEALGGATLWRRPVVTKLDKVLLLARATILPVARARATTGGTG